MLSNKNIGYSKELNIMGTFVKIDYKNEKVTLMDEYEDIHELPFNDVIELKHIGFLDGERGKIDIYQNDVLKLKNGNDLYEIDFVEDEKIVLYQLDEKLKRTKRSKSIEKSKLDNYKGSLELIDSIHLLRHEIKKSVEFNVKIFRSATENGVTYYYAGNNVEDKTVDLIKAIFLEHELLQDAYERTTLSYEEFLGKVETGEIKEVDPMNLKNYVLGMTHDSADNANTVFQPQIATLHKFETIIPETEIKKTVDEIEDYCQECHNNEENCNCELWGK
ncbi:hypothetical protein P9294_gp125 [Bacillus phage FADO]|uniref:Uncharacterized protein n=1 Tax=Bacillus phage FADO TaxID=2917160 RepID=A0AAE9G6J9_9CAUD|nr:hypothetical protein P9294_gp125 [Bacillus phage FADO]UNY48840.1 hypothetical protein fado_125 [Bacillus phage FADO]